MSTFWRMVFLIAGLVEDTIARLAPHGRATR